MARSVTFLQMRTAVATRGAYENSADITTTVLSDYVNEAVAETWDILVGKWEDYYVTRSTINVSANQDGITVPTDFYKLRLLQIVDSSMPSGYRRLRPHDLDAAHTFWAVSHKHYRYRLEGGLLYLAPIPAVAETLRLFYIPACPLLVADGDTFDGINGYEQLAVQLALLRCQKRQDQPTQETMAEVQRLTARVRTAADSRDADEPWYLDPRGPRDGHLGWDEDG